jgi:hypothetical protein
MHRFNYKVRTKASLATAWQVYSNWNLWRNFANIYGELNWAEGKPWEVGSKMEIEILQPAKVIVNRLIICCEPSRELGWIDRALGMTLGQWVEFEAQSAGVTLVHTWGELAPSGLMYAGRTAEQLLAEFTETWHENYRRACDERAEISESQTRDSAHPSSQQPGLEKKNRPEC